MLPNYSRLPKISYIASFLSSRNKSCEGRFSQIYIIGCFCFTLPELFLSSPVFVLFDFCNILSCNLKLLLQTNTYITSVMSKSPMIVTVLIVSIALLWKHPDITWPKIPPKIPKGVKPVLPCRVPGDAVLRGTWYKFVDTHVSFRGIVTYTPPHSNPKHEVWSKVNFLAEDSFKKLLFDGALHQVLYKSLV